jgi:two-component system sensor histidine kinase BaeS
MKISLTYRLFLSILSATSLAILFLFLIMQWSLNRGFYQYLGKMEQATLEQVVNNLERVYSERKSWDFLKNTPPQRNLVGGKTFLEREAVRPRIDEPGMNEYGGHPPAAPPFDAGHTGGPLIILNAERKAVLGSNQKDEQVNFRPIIVHGETVGYAGLLSPKHFLHPVQLHFLSQQTLSLAFSAAGMVLVVVFISLPLARRVIKPIRAMAQATHDISSGKYTTRISMTSSDELGQLARDFNNMALTLEKHEKDRRQWVADISHELRTPIAVLRGEIEALLDGIRSVTPETVLSLHAEVMRLNRLVEDLYQLSLSDIGALTYRREILDLVEVLRDSMESHQAKLLRKGINVTANISESAEVMVFADRERLNQLFMNLFENSMRYTDAGGSLAVSLSSSKDQITLEFQDSAPGVPGNELDRLFERLYRVEGSRSRTTGGAGLGLAICKNIVEAHEGTIAAHQSPLGGLLIRITFPSSGRSA